VNGLPEDVSHFVTQFMESVEQLEVLLLLRRSPERAWSAGEVARELYSHPTSVIQRLELLLGQGLLREHGQGCFQYAPRSSDLDRTVGVLAELYRERRVAIITLIASKPLENVKAFADAFRIRKKRED
jgi:hypothetical protein